MDDIIRGAILTKDRREAKKIQENIKDYFEVDEIRYREYGKDKIYGYYGQYHIRVIVDNILVEIQLMSKKLWEYKEKAHQIYSQSRLRIVQEPEYQKTPEFQELQKKSKDLFKSGNS